MKEETIKVKLNETHTSFIREMVPLYGDNESEVIKTIIIMFLHENSEKVDTALCLTSNDLPPQK